MKVARENKMTYDRKVVGARLRRCRVQREWSRAYVAGRTGIVEKYYADIERGTCGMSIETMMALAELYNLSLDDFIYGPEAKRPGSGTQQFEAGSLEEQLEQLPARERERCAELVTLFIQSMREKV